MARSSTVAHVLVLKNAMVAALGAAFLAAAEALEVGAISDHSTSPARRQFLVIPVAALNTVFVYGIFSSLSKTPNNHKVSSTEASQNVFYRFIRCQTEFRIVHPFF